MGKSRLSATVSQWGDANRRLGDRVARLEALLNEPAEDRIEENVLEVLDAMLENLQQQSHLEDENEYLAEVLEQYPNWHPQVEQLRAQYDLLHKQLRQIRDRVAATHKDETVIPEARRQIRDWIATYQEREERERRLLLEAFTLDTGAGE